MVMQRIRVDLQTRLHPIRIRARADDSVALFINVKNKGEVAVPLSLKLTIPSQTLGLGFDTMAVRKVLDVDLGELKPGEEREEKVLLFSNRTLEPGDVLIKVRAYIHDRVPQCVLFYKDKEIRLRCV